MPECIWQPCPGQAARNNPSIQLKSHRIKDCSGQIYRIGSLLSWDVLRDHVWTTSPHICARVHSSQWQTFCYQFSAFLLSWFSASLIRRVPSAFCSGWLKNTEMGSMSKCRGDKKCSSIYAVTKTMWWTSTALFWKGFSNAVVILQALRLQKPGSGNNCYKNWQF